MTGLVDHVASRSSGLHREGNAVLSAQFVVRPIVGVVEWSAPAMGVAMEADAPLQC